MKSAGAIAADTADNIGSFTSTVESRKAPGPDDLSRTPDDEPSQPRLKNYPAKEQAGRKRCFKSAWYQLHPWLEYSQTADAAFCFACRHFQSSKAVEQAFTSTGFSNWKRAHEINSGLTQHDKCDSHLTAFVMWTQRRELKKKSCW